MTAESAIVYLDANCFILAIESGDETAARLRSLLDAARSNRGRVATSELTLAEIMAGVEKKQEPWLKRIYLNLLIYSRVVDLRPVSRDVLLETAVLRAKHPRKLLLPDAIHLATAIQLRCRYFMTDDRRISSPRGGPTLVRSDAAGMSMAMDAVNHK